VGSIIITLSQTVCRVCQFWKSVNNWRRYGQKWSGTFFGPPCKWQNMKCQVWYLKWQITSSCLSDQHSLFITRFKVWSDIKALAVYLCPKTLYWQKFDTNPSMYTKDTTACKDAYGLWRENVMLYHFPLDSRKRFRIDRSIPHFGALNLWGLNPIKIAYNPTVLKWGGQNYSHLHQVLSYVLCPKLLKSANVSRSYSKNKSGTFFMDHGV